MVDELTINHMEAKQEPSNQQVNPSTPALIDSHKQLKFDEVKSLIDTIEYQDDATHKSSLCIITLKNSYRIIAKSQMNSSEAFDSVLSQKMAYYTAMTDVCKAAHLLMLEQQYQLRQVEQN